MDLQQRTSKGWLEIFDKFAKTDLFTGTSILNYCVKFLSSCSFISSSNFIKMIYRIYYDYLDDGHLIVFH